jgi:hypothetical protein
MEKKDYLAEISNQLNKLFKASKEGYTSADIDRHRPEGFMHAGVFMEIVTPAEMSALMEEVHYSIFGKSIQDRKLAKPANWSDIEIDYDKFDSPTYLR